MTPDSWALKHNISREPVDGIDPLIRIGWALKMFNGRVVEVRDIVVGEKWISNEKT